MDRNYDVISFSKNFFKKSFQKIFIFRRPGVAVFADIIKILVKTILKDSRKIRIIRNYVSKWNLYLYFLI